MKKSFNGRNFQFWEYTVSHGMLLIRSPKSIDKIAGAERNIDIVFGGVQYVDLPRHLPNLELEEPTPDEIMIARKRLGERYGDNAVTVIKSGDQRFLVVSAGVQVSENDGEIFGSPFAQKNGG